MEIKEIKERFFAFRNGIVAHALREAGMPYTVIFGLQLPQIAEIVREIGVDHNLAGALWADRECRESRLLACRLFDKTLVGKEKAIEMANDARTREESDILSFFLLRHLPFAGEIAEELDGYSREALKRNLE